MNLNPLIEAIKNGPLNKFQVAEQSGISRTTLDNMLSGADAKISTIEAVCTTLGISASLLFDEEANFNEQPATNFIAEREGAKNDKGKIPLYDNVLSIGGTNELVANVDDEGGATEWIDAGDWFPGATAAIHHYGDSMVEYPSGCILALKRVNDMRLLVNGEHYVIETDEFRITKQVQDDGGDYIMAYSSNREVYPDGHLIHAPIRIPKASIRHLDLVLGCVIKRVCNRPIIIKSK